MPVLVLVKNLQIQNFNHLILEPDLHQNFRRKELQIFLEN